MLQSNFSAFVLSALVILLVTLTVSVRAETEVDRSRLLEDRVQALERELLRLKAAAMDTRQKRSDDGGPLEAVVARQAQELSSLTAKLQAAETKVSTLGSTFVRWGRSQCPSSSETVYTGVAGGSKHNEQGGGANRLCLTHNPQFDQASTYGGQYSNIHGIEWYIAGHDHPDVPCAVCRVPHPTTVMIPGTKTCPQGWTLQYSGHITAANFHFTSNSEFLCADGNPEDREGTGVNLDDGSFFMYSVAACGSLPCPPYVNGKVVTCVVCSK